MMNYCCHGSYTPFPTLKNKIRDEPFFRVVEFGAHLG